MLFWELILKKLAFFQWETRGCIRLKLRNRSLEHRKYKRNMWSGLSQRVLFYCIYSNLWWRWEVPSSAILYYHLAFVQHFSHVRSKHLQVSSPPFKYKGTGEGTMISQGHLVAEGNNISQSTTGSTMLHCLPWDLQRSKYVPSGSDSWMLINIINSKLSSQYEPNKSS